MTVGGGLLLLKLVGNETQISMISNNNTTRETLSEKWNVNQTLYVPQ